MQAAVVEVSSYQMELPGLFKPKVRTLLASFWRRPDLSQYALLAKQQQVRLASSCALDSGLLVTHTTLQGGRQL